MSDGAIDQGAHGGVTPGHYYGHGLPYLPLDNYPGKIIAVEGTDGVGRSTQIWLLREWLEVRGYGVVETGWTRSPLMQPTIDLAKSSNTLNKLTFVLLYACDFADRLEKEIIPALKAGFNRYNESRTTQFAQRYNPNAITSASLPWTDINGDDIAQDNTNSQIVYPQVRVNVIESPLETVVTGAGRTIESFDKLKHLFAGT